MKEPKDCGFSMPAEWHPHERCWMAWPCHEETWSKIGLKRAGLAYARVAEAIAQFEPLTLLVRPGDEPLVQHACSSKIELLPLPLNDSWTRDTGPSFLLNAQQKLAGVDWIHNAWGGNYVDYALDNQIATAILQKLAVPIFQAPLVMEGGAFHVDGEGTILSTKECLLNPNRNPHLTQEQIEHFLYAYLGAKKCIWLNQGLLGDETDGHVDEIACFIGPAKILCLITKDKDDPNYERLQENYAILQDASDAKGRPLEVFTVEQPPATYLDGARLTLSYINFYRANKGIVMPAFGYEAYDEQAYQLIRALVPDSRVIQVEALDIFAGGGGIHCITQQQPRAKSQTERQENIPTPLRYFLAFSALQT